MTDIFKAQSVSFGAKVSTQETLNANVDLQETLQAKITAKADLKATVTAEENLKAVVTAEESLKGNITITSYTVDSELSKESTNPVQNKVVTAALDKKAEVLIMAKNTDIDKLFR